MSLSPVFMIFEVSADAQAAAGPIVSASLEPKVRATCAWLATMSVGEAGWADVKREASRLLMGCHGKPRSSR